MKPLSYSLIAAAVACGFATAQTTAYTTPVGYTTKALAPNQYTLVGLTVHEATKSAGIITGESANSVTVAGANFTTLLGAFGDTYILELADGTVQEITAWAGDVLTTPDDITGKVTPGTTTYKLRKAATVSSIFGATNSLGLSPDTDGSLTGTDFIMLPNASGAFDTVYYFNDGAGTLGWFDTAGDPADNKPIVYPDGFYVRRSAGSLLNLVVSGEVKTTKTGGVLKSGYNYLSAVAPVGLTLGTSGLEAFLTPDTDGSLIGTDMVMVQQGATYRTSYYFNDGAGTLGWFDTAGDPAEDIALDGGFLIRAAAGPKAFTVNVPASYSTL
jgi:hypothetical protein